MDRILATYFMDFIPMTMKKIFKGIHHGYTRHQMRLLFEINKHGEKPMRFYGERLMISKPNMTSQVSKLVDEDLLERVQDKNDRRKVMIKITENGQETLKEHGEAMRNAVIERLSVLSEEDKQELVESFETIKRVLKKIEE